MVWDLKCSIKLHRASTAMFRSFCHLCISLSFYFSSTKACLFCLCYNLFVTDDMFVHVWDLAQWRCNLYCITHNANNNFDPIFSIYLFMYNHTWLKFYLQKMLSQTNNVFILPLALLLSLWPSQRYLSKNHNHPIHTTISRCLSNAMSFVFFFPRQQ